MLTAESKIHHNQVRLSWHSLFKQLRPQVKSEIVFQKRSNLLFWQFSDLASGQLVGPTKLGASLLLCSLTNWNLPHSAAAAPTDHRHPPPTSPRPSCWCWWWSRYISAPGIESLWISVVQNHTRLWYFPYMYINIYKYVLKTSSQCDRHTRVSVMLFSALPKKGNQLHTLAAILVSNLIGPVKSGQHMYWTIRVVTDRVCWSYLLHVN